MLLVAVVLFLLAVIAALFAPSKWDMVMLSLGLFFFALSGVSGLPAGLH